MIMIIFVEVWAFIQLQSWYNKIADDGSIYMYSN